MTIFQYGLADILNSFRKSDLIRMLGRQDMNLRYRRSKFGPFWITISMGIQILTLGLVFGQLFGTSIHKFLPFLAIGIILWSYLTSIVSEGCSSFIVAEGLITQLDLPIAFHFFRHAVSDKLELSPFHPRVSIANDQYFLDGHDYRNFLYTFS